MFTSSSLPVCLNTYWAAFSNASTRQVCSQDGFAEGSAAVLLAFHSALVLGFFGGTCRAFALLRETKAALRKQLFTVFQYAKVGPARPRKGML
eukprot:1414789-Amphidinium_carterae.1